MKALPAWFLLCVLAFTVRAQQAAADARINELERQLELATRQIDQLNTPSTLLSLEPEFAPAFRPGAHSSGGHLFVNYKLTSRDNIYARHDQFNNDPVTGRNVRPFNFRVLPAHRRAVAAEF